MKHLNQMTMIFLAAIILLIGEQLHSQTQDLAWAKTMGGSSPEDGSDIAVDASGNIYSIGQFDGTADFDPGPGTYPFTDANNLGVRDIYISKLDASGNFIWAKQISARSGNTYSYKPSIAIDHNGDIVYSGIFNGTVDFDPGPGTMNMTGANFDVFVSKISAAGNFIWAKQFSGAMTQVVCGLKTDAAGNIYTTGYFGDSTDFDPGPGAYKLGTSSGYFAAFVCKLNSSGDFVWAKKVGGDAQQQGLGDLGRAITLDPSGNVYVAGAFDGTEDFDPGIGVANLSAPGTYNYQAFILKFDNSGNFVWAKNTGGTGSTDYMRARTIAVDANQNVYYGGDYVGNCDFDPGVGTTILSNVTDGQVFLSKLDSSGNFVWADALRGTGQTDQVRGMTLDNSANIYIAGDFVNTVDFDPSANVYNLTTVYDQTYFSKLDSSGNFLWVKTFENGNSSSASIALDANESIYLTGELGDYWTVDFDPGPGTYTVPVATGYSDIFVCKLSEAGLGIHDQDEAGNLIAYPNPANSVLTIQNPKAEKTKLELYNMFGELISSCEMEGSGKQLDVSNLSNGMYFLIAETSEGKTVTKIQVAH